MMSGGRMAPRRQGQSRAHPPSHFSSRSRSRYLRGQPIPVIVIATVAFIAVVYRTFRSFQLVHQSITIFADTSTSMSMSASLATSHTQAEAPLDHRMMGGVLPDGSQQQPSHKAAVPNGHVADIMRLHPPPATPRVYLYITTHFSQQHVRYFHCCWPRLVQQSPLVQSAHIIVAATNITPIPLVEMEYLQNDLFARNPSYALHFPTHDEHLRNCVQYTNRRQQQHHSNAPNANNSSNNNNNNHDDDSINDRRKNPLKVPVNYKQCMANQAMQLGTQLGWIPRSHHSSNGSSTIDTGNDWLVRLNPDVLIRSSAWLRSTMTESTIDGIFVSCGPKTRQLHTDFFAVRLRSMSGDAFQTMGKVRNRLNHERTAFRAFRHLLDDGDHDAKSALNGNSGNNANDGNSTRNRRGCRYVPHVDPSEGTCRVRGEKAPVYHVHDSCLEGSLVCSALNGWDL